MDHLAKPHEVLVQSNLAKAVRGCDWPASICSLSMTRSGKKRRLRVADLAA
jgi:hypothetical protein